MSCLVIVALLVAVILLSACGGAGGHPGGSEQGSRARSADAPEYVALGDSLSVGIQPTAGGRQVRTDRGYVNHLLLAERRRVPGIRLVQMGCPGDTTTSLLTGSGDVAAARAYHCDRTDGSQLAAALAFIRAHRGQVRLVSLDIGANDLLACAGQDATTRLAVLAHCVATAEATVSSTLPKILHALAGAVAPGTPLINGTIYNPFLVGSLSTSPQLREIARASVGVLAQFNAGITRLDAAAGFRTADVAAAFASDDTTPTHAAIQGRSLTVPRDLAVLCADTWLCTGPPRGPNVHPDAAGYTVMGRAYARQLPGPAPSGT